MHKCITVALMNFIHIFLSLLLFLDLCIVYFSVGFY